MTFGKDQRESTPHKSCCTFLWEEEKAERRGWSDEDPHSEGLETPGWTLKLWPLSQRSSLPLAAEQSMHEPIPGNLQN